MPWRSNPSAPIRHPRQVRALASPVRQEVLDALETGGPCSISELARHLGRAADALYFHVRHLVKAGLVVESERRQVGRHAFATYDVVARPLQVDRAGAKPADLHRIAGGVLRLALRDFGRGFDDPATVSSGKSRNHWVVRAQGWLDAATLAELNARLDGILALLRETHPAPGRQAIALAIALTPAPPRRGPRTDRAPIPTKRATGTRSPGIDSQHRRTK